MAKTGIRTGLATAVLALLLLGGCSSGDDGDGNGNGNGEESEQGAY